jgi:hypothetical protein
MVELVETMLRMHKDLPKAKTPHEQESLKRTIAATDKQTDDLVYGTGEGHFPYFRPMSSRDGVS